MMLVLFRVGYQSGLNNWRRVRMWRPVWLIYVLYQSAKHRLTWKHQFSCRYTFVTNIVTYRHVWALSLTLWLYLMQTTTLMNQLSLSVSSMTEIVSHTR